MRVKKTAQKNLKKSRTYSYHKSVDPTPSSTPANADLPPTSPTVPLIHNDTKKHYLNTSILFLAISLVVLIFALAYYFYTIQNKTPVVNKLPTTPPVQSTVYNPNLQQGPFVCPSLPDFCQKGEYKEGSISGRLAKGAPIFAAFDGQLQQIPAFKDVKEMTILSLTNGQTGLQAVYFIRGKVPFSERNVKAAEEITTATGLPIPEFGHQSFVFRLYRVGNGVSWQPANLTLESFSP